MESHHRLARSSGDGRSRFTHALAVLGPGLLLTGLLLGCAPQSPAEPLPRPDPPTEDGKGWKPVTG